MSMYQSPRTCKMKLSVQTNATNLCSSPIASKAKTPKQSKPKKNSIVQSFLQRFEKNNKQKEEIVSTNDTVDGELFSPKYSDVPIHANNDDVFMSPPSSPIKKREKLDAECQKSVQSIKEAVWSSVNEEIDGFLFMKHAPILGPNYFKNKAAYLPKSQFPNRHTLVLDLDETLVHCSIDKVEECDMVFPVVFGGDSFKVYMRKRPFFVEFLQEVSKNFEVVLFTASQECYANKLMNLVDPEQKLIHHRLFRQHCCFVEGNFVKNLCVLGRDLSKTVIIDNSPPAFTHQINNGIPIISWYNDKDDDELMKMIPLLNKLRTLNDVRPAIKKYFQIKQLLKSI